MECEYQHDEEDRPHQLQRGPNTVTLKVSCQLADTGREDAIN